MPRGPQFSSSKFGLPICRRLILALASGAPCLFPFEGGVTWN
jgi:hypothetical protein